MAAVLEKAQERSLPMAGEEKSQSELVIVGLNHKRASIEEREKVIVEGSRLEKVLAELHRKDVLSGVTVLSTCNRVEFYGSSANATLAEDCFREFFSRRCPGIERFLYVMRNGQAVRHLFRVAAGLDSMVVGEHQVLGQAKNAYLKAQETGHTDKLINKVFQRAFYVGKLVRSKTGISRGITSCGGAAIALAEKIFGKLGTVKIMLVGAGKMAESAAQHLLSKKALSIVISNRRLEKAEELSTQFGGVAMGLEEGMHRIHEMDVVIASTTCPHYLVTKNRAKEILEKRDGRPLVLIDLGMPRNIDPEVKDIEGVHLYDIDSLETVVNETISKRQAEITAAEDIVRQCCDEFAESCVSMHHQNEL